LVVSQFKLMSSLFKKSARLFKSFLCYYLHFDYLFCRDFNLSGRVISLKIKIIVFMFRDLAKSDLQVMFSFEKAVDALLI